MDFYVGFFPRLGYSPCFDSFLTNSCCYRPTMVIFNQVAINEA